MNDAAIFITVAQQHGFSPQAARVALDTITQRLQVRRFRMEGLHPTTFNLSSFYIYRTGAKGPGTGEGESESSRSRLLLAFPSADSALGFAQRNRLASTPRLLRMSAARLLATLIQRPTISAILFADEPDEAVSERSLPPGLRLERTALLDLLKEE